MSKSIQDPLSHSVTHKSIGIAKVFNKQQVSVCHYF
jgi:hypothetical protein